MVLIILIDLVSGLEQFHALTGLRNDFSNYEMLFKEF